MIRGKVSYHRLLTVRFFSVCHREGAGMIPGPQSGILLEKVTLAQVSLIIFPSFPIRIISPTPHFHLVIHSVTIGAVLV